MPDNYYSEVNENGVVTPFRDLAAYNGVIANTKLIKDTVGWSGKNLNGITLEEVKAANNTGTWSGNVYTINSVPFTFNTQNGYVSSISCGNATASATITIFVSKILNISKALKLNGCPSDGGASTYKLLAVNTGGSSLGLDEDYGGGANLGVVTGDFRIQLRVYSGQNPNGKVFKPMIYDADILDPTYEPYFGSTAFPRSEQAVLGAKNLFSPQFVLSDNAGGTHSEADGVITINTTISNYSGSYFNRTQIRNYFADKPKQGWILSFDYKSDISCNGYIGVNASAKIMPTEWTHYTQEIPDISQIDHISFYNMDATKTPVIQAKNFMFSLDGGEYAIYAMTNSELTDKVQGIIDAATNAADFAAFKTALAAL